MNAPRAGLRWARTGTGPGIVCTHGAGDDNTHWAALAPHLARYGTVVTWDLPGHGGSAPRPGYGPGSRDECLDDLAAMVEAAGGGPAVLVGHSFGGYLSLAAAITRPGLVRALVLVATGPGFRSDARRAQWNADVEAYAARLGNPAAALAAQYDALVLDRLAEVRAPVLQVCGERDRRFHAALEVVAAAIPGASTVIVPGAGHAVASTHADAVAEAVGAFLGRLGG